MPSPPPTLRESRGARYAVFFLLYMAQGLTAGFGLTAVVNYLTAEGVGPAAVGGFAALVGLPWTFQFVWGPLIDRWQGSAMGRRRPWVIAGQGFALFASLGLMTVAEPDAQLDRLALAFFAHSLFASIQDAAVDAMAITCTPDDQRGRVNSFMRGGMIVGVGVGAAGFAWLIRAQGIGAAATVHSVALGVLIIPTLLVQEGTDDAWISWRHRGLGAAGPGFRLGQIFGRLACGLLAPASLRLFGGIALVYGCSSIFYRSYSYTLIHDFGWPDDRLSVLSGTAGSAVALGGAVVGGILSDRLGHRRLLRLVMLAVGAFLVAFNLASPAWGSPAWAGGGLVAWATVDPIFSVAAMPVLMAICRPGVEGSQFTAYMALVNLCDVAGSFVAGRALEGGIDGPTLGLGCGLIVLTALGCMLVGSGWSRRPTAGS